MPRNTNVYGDSTALAPFKYMTDSIWDSDNAVENYTYNNESPANMPVQVEHYNNCLDEQGQNIENFNAFSFIGQSFGDLVGGFFDGIFGSYGKWVFFILCAAIIYGIFF